MQVWFEYWELDPADEMGLLAILNRKKKRKVKETAGHSSKVKIW